MISLTRLDGSEMLINADLIEIIEETPDTHIILLNGNRFLVKQSARSIVEKIINYNSKIMHRAAVCRKQKYLRKLVVNKFRRSSYPDPLDQ